ncbi:Fc.00g026810.m01.CDS01 [Cosmosporella sp. VM-42]
MFSSDMETQESTGWQKAAREKREAVLHLIPEAWRLPVELPSAEEQRDVTGGFIETFLSPQEILITQADAVEIVEQTSTGAWKARDVAEAFCHRAALAHQMVNCLHEIFFSAALEDAQRADDYLAKHGKPVGRLHGLPISLKDQFHVKGVETTMGYVGWIGTFEGKRGTGKELQFESELVQELRSQGAILYCKTSVPHTLMTGETVNNIIGYTWNPKNRLLSSGGSSGGEGALLALKGSCLGLGTDIGGSVRIPSAFNGLFCLKPSSGRIPYEGVANSMDGQMSLLSVIGPMATSVRSLRLLMESVLETQPWLRDPLCVSLPWKTSMDGEQLKQKRLTFGLLKCDGHVSPQPPVRRAMHLVEAAIERLGHKTIEWKPPSHQEGIHLGYEIWKLDGGTDIYHSMSLAQEPLAAQLSHVYGNEPGKERSASEIAAINIAKRAYQKRYMDYWNSTARATDTNEPVCAVIAPVAPFAAARPSMYDYYGYSVIVNVLDYPAAVLPVTTADKSVDVPDEAYEPLNDLDAKVLKSYDSNIYHGTPVSIQIICRRFEEEKLLSLTELLSNALSSRT